MMPPLVAEESIQASNRVALGSGSLKAPDRRALIAKWERAAGHVRAKAEPIRPEMLEAMGIGYHVVEPTS
jgi:hypothetical protein